MEPCRIIIGTKLIVLGTRHADFRSRYECIFAINKCCFYLRYCSKHCLSKVPLSFLLYLLSIGLVVLNIIMFCAGMTEIPDIIHNVLSSVAPIREEYIIKVGCLL